MNLSPFDLSRCTFLSGPTASGKTAVGLELAGLLGAEIISLDSMAVYRGMDIGTAKPTAHEQQLVRHHLVDVVDPDEDFSLARYVEAAHAAAADIASRGKHVLFVGGTPLYLKALLRGIFSGPAADWKLRQALHATAAEQGFEALHARLAAVDPQTATRLHPRDTRRVIRALEVWEKTGRSISQWQQQFQHAQATEPRRVFVLDWPRAELVRRIDERVEAMFAAGFVEEVRELMERYPSLSRTASQAVGYREVLEHLNGERSLAETISLVKLRTRQFAKRQMTWFRSLAECRSVAMTNDKLGQVARQIAAEIPNNGPGLSH